MKYRLLVADEAKEELVDYLNFLGESFPQKVSIRFKQAWHRMLDRIEQQPFGYRLLADGQSRRILLDKHIWVYYKVFETDIVITSIFHTARKPK